ncbi:MAG: hypothetical protein QUU85_15325, partial [Candidatus Eisenbacteria bacterium]|nr:hypothetical protein [Candidatus Eisenbacteria bacterium]
MPVAQAGRHRGRQGAELRKDLDRRAVAPSLEPVLHLDGDAERSLGRSQRHRVCLLYTSDAAD